MQPIYKEFSDYINSSKIDEQSDFLSFGQHPNIENGLKFDIPSPDLNFTDVPVNPPDPQPDDFSLSFTLSPGGESFVPVTSLSPDGVSSDPPSGWTPAGDATSSDDSDTSDPILKYISQMLMEENMESKPPMFYDSFELKATEKSWYDVLGEQYPPLLGSPQPYISYESPDSILSANGSDYGGNASTTAITSSNTVDFVDSLWTGNVEGLNPPLSQPSFPSEYHFQSNSQLGLQYSVNNLNNQPDIGSGFMGTSANEMVQNMFSNTDSVLLFRRGMEEASKFLPSSSQLGIDMESNRFSAGQKEKVTRVVEKGVKVERRHTSPNSSRGRKHHNRDDSDFDEGRSNKQSAVHVEEDELSEMFDKVLLWPGIAGGKCWDNNESCCDMSETKDTKEHGACKTQQPDEPVNRTNGGKSHSKKQVTKKETVDLRTLLILCAQAINANDFRTANELLKQIRQNSSPLGDWSQRLAHFFANGLEARMAGNGSRASSFFVAIAAKKMTAADMLKAYKTHLSACPFKRLLIFFSVKMILKAAEKAETLHIIDFGVLYGFQWPVLIQKLAKCSVRPPKLRITGIELPQRGFRPAERIEETGLRLAKYCDRFKVPFEYNPVAVQNWETIQIEDLKIRRDEVLAVNCHGRFTHLLDDTVDVECPRNAVLNLVRKMKPDIFVHGIVNGSYNSPFFVTRFREALFHFSSLFDMLDATLPHEDPERLMFESEFCGREAMNVIACEGLERVERPETYKQWHVRTMRAGFKALPLDQELVQLLNDKVMVNYHKDFVIDEDSDWMLQGWKGRIVYACSSWVPA